MRSITRSLAGLAVIFGSMSAFAGPGPDLPDPALPKVGDALPLFGTADWPKLAWLYDAPLPADAAGKVVVHWFCAPKIKSCTDELARIINLRDTNHVYIIAYINSTARESKKLDPIRESEGVGRGTVAYGPGVAKLVKAFGLGEGSIVVDVDGKVKAVTTSGDINELDSRDSIVNTLIGQIKDFTTSHDGPTAAKPGEKMAFVLKIQLASWLTFSQKSPPELTLTAPTTIKCDKTTTIADHTLTATATCTAPKGIYEIQSNVRFGYDVPGKTAVGTAEDGAKWKFTVK